MRYAVVLLAACGSSSAPTEKPAPFACPATYGAIVAGTPCPDDVGAACSFPEGNCSCGSQSYCGGVAPPDDLLAELEKPVWQCKPVRTDGCPETPPSGSCPTDGQTCLYGDCCVEPVTCTSGTWVTGERSCPP